MKKNEKYLNLNGILKKYNFKKMFKSYPFYISIIITFSYSFFLILNNKVDSDLIIKLSELIIDVFPELIGINLGVLIVFITFSDKIFLKYISRNINKNERTYLDIFLSNFSWMIIVNVLLLVFSIFFKLILLLELSIDYFLTLQTTINVCCVVLLIFMMFYSLLLLIKTIENLWNYSRVYLIYLNNPPNPDP